MEKNEGGGLPPGLELLWGIEERSRRRPRAGLSLERIVQAAIEVADAEGLTQLSMSRVAERLGFTTMSLYRHVTNKDELLMLMADAAVGVPPADMGGPDRGPDDGGDGGAAGGWRSGLQRWARAIFDLYRSHPWLLQLPISGPPLGPRNLDWVEAGLRALRPTGLRGDAKVAVIQLIGGYVRNEARLSGDLAAGAAAAADGGEPVSYGRMLARLIDADRYPALFEVVESGMLDAPGGYTDEDFDFGLQRVLDGIDVLVETVGRSQWAG